MTDAPKMFDKPAAKPAAPKPEPMLDKAHEPEVNEGASARLRAFEDEKFGTDATRINGQIERGSGSAYARMSDEDRATYEKLERCVAAEAKLSAAHQALSVAEAEVLAAEAALDAANHG